MLPVDRCAGSGTLELSYILGLIKIRIPNICGPKKLFKKLVPKKGSKNIWDKNDLVKKLLVPEKMGVKICSKNS